jgi:hypothetical protein
MVNITVADNQAFHSFGAGGGFGGFGFIGGAGGPAGHGQVGQGGGVGVVAGTTVNALNSLFGDNAATVAPDFSGNFTSASHNLLSDGTGSNLMPANPDPNGNIVGSSSSPIDPLLGPLQNNGGPTQTQALLAGSPAIDAGTSVGAPKKDQRGVARGSPPDIGAYEVEPSSSGADRDAVFADLDAVSP